MGENVISEKGAAPSSLSPPPLFNIYSDSSVP